jgi:hypothetical protein
MLLASISREEIGLLADALMVAGPMSCKSYAMV